MMKTDRLKQLNTDTLAYIGDGVYELFMRRRILEGGISKAFNLHKAVTGYVKAGAQAAAVRQMFDELDEGEQRLVKRARNHKFTSKAKNADPITYKWATAFEALVGYLYLSGSEDRLRWVMERAAGIIEASESQEK